MAAAARDAVRDRRESALSDSAACSASAVCATSKGLTGCDQSASSSAAPACRDSTRDRPRSDSTGPSLATRFIPSRSGLTSSTSASEYAARDRA